MTSTDTLTPFRDYLEAHGFALTERRESVDAPYDLYIRNFTEAWLFHAGEWHIGEFIGPCDQLGLRVFRTVLEEMP